MAKRMSPRSSTAAERHTATPKRLKRLCPSACSKLLVDTSPNEKTNDPTPTSIYPFSQTSTPLGQSLTYQARPEILTFRQPSRKHREINRKYAMHSHDHHMRPVDRDEAQPVFFESRFVRRRMKPGIWVRRREDLNPDMRGRRTRTISSPPTVRARARLETTARAERG